MKCCAALHLIVSGTLDTPRNKPASVAAPYTHCTMVLALFSFTSLNPVNIFRHLFGAFVFFFPLSKIEKNRIECHGIQDTARVIRKFDFSHIFF